MSPLFSLQSIIGCFSLYWKSEYCPMSTLAAKENGYALVSKIEKRAQKGLRQDCKKPSKNAFFRNCFSVEKELMREVTAVMSDD